jgi:hypothetical protein
MGIITLSFCLLFGQEIRLPESIAGAPGEFVLVRPETAGKVVRYVGLDSGLSVFPSGQLADQKATVVIAVNPGKYRLLAYTAQGDIPSPPIIIQIVIGNGPGPMPVDPLADSLQAIYGAIQEPGRADTVARLATVYRKFSQGFKANRLNDLFGQMKSETAGIKGCDTLRERLADYLDIALGTDGAATIGPELTSKIKAEFSKIAGILGGLK